MRSIQTKLMVLILAGVVISVALVGGIGIFSAQKAIDDDSIKIINSICSEKAQQLNNTLGRVEQTVNILSHYVIDDLDSVEKLSDPEYEEAYIASLQDLVHTAAHETEGAVSVYVRLNPDIASPDGGIFNVIDPDTGQFQAIEPTDISAYSPDDTEHTGWYYQPVKAGKAIWMDPYHNKNIDMYMISYVRPVYKDNNLIGVVGMDIDFRYIINAAESIRIYDTGFAFLTDMNFNIVFHKDIEAGISVLEFSESFDDAEKASLVSKELLFEYTFDGVAKKAAFCMLENGMCLGVTAPVTEIDRTKNELIALIVIIGLVSMIVLFFITSSIARRIVQPLKELNRAAEKIANGELEVTLGCNTNDEVGRLTESFRETVKQLKIRIDYINDLAYTDKLTDVRNNTAYLSAVSQLKNDIESKTARFAVAVIDINGLKQINDNYGHDLGNRLIIAMAEAAAQVFGRDNIYRTGGDEFVVIMAEEDEARCESMKQEFMKLIKTPRDGIGLSAAIGVATYDSNDDSYEAVFKRADELMYDQKSQMKANGETSILYA